MSQKVPSFAGLSPATEASSRSKRANLKADTKQEVRLRSALWRLGLRFRKNVASLPGKPDVVFSRSKVVVFCDGDFWHGRNWPQLKLKLERGANALYWIGKISTNIERDKKNAAVLEDLGWHVIRLWETDINKDPIGKATFIKHTIDARFSGQRTSGYSADCEGCDHLEIC
jgi:DNA mismatch endonuclease, patch repair protein